MTSYAAPASSAASNVDRMMSQRRSLRPGRPKPAMTKPLVTSQGDQRGIVGRGGNFQAFGPAAQSRLAAGGTAQGAAIPAAVNAAGGEGMMPNARPWDAPPPGVDQGYGRQRGSDSARAASLLASMNGGGQVMPTPSVAIDPTQVKPMGGPPSGPGGPMDNMGFMQRMGGQLPPELMTRLQALRAGSQSFGNYPQVGGAGMPPSQGMPNFGPSGGGMMPPSALPGISAAQPGGPQMGLDAYWRSPNVRAF